VAYVARPIGAVRLHGRNPLFVPCSAFVMRGAALALLDASAIGLMPGSIAARGCATAGVAVRPGTERFASLITLCTFMCDVPFHLELSVRAYDCEPRWIVPASATVDRPVFANGFKVRSSAQGNADG